MSDGRGEPDVPRPENDTAAHAHAAGTGGGFTDPTPEAGGDGIIVQGGRQAPDSHSAQAIGPKQDDPRAIGPKQDDPRAIGPKQDDPRTIGPKQDDPRAVGDGIIVQGGRTGHPDGKSRQKRAKKKPKTMALIIGGVMVAAVGGAVVGRQLGHDPAATVPQAAATPTAVVPAAPAPSGSTGSAGPAPAPGGSAPASPAPAASQPPARSGTGTGTGSAAPPRTTPTAQPKPSGTPAPVAAPVLTLRPAGVQEYCANGEWPHTVTIRNSGGGTLDWTVGPLPAGVTAAPGAGSLAAGASQEIVLGGRAEQLPPNGHFTLDFASNGGTGRVTVTCA
ncbi:hypothetical protein ACFXA3_36520 [Streptomyces sp. NPDC059456]|uniref:hypothetical protein n=1 Tax=Streptomyces sp. NPDC059456 TaxID=3346838 RepID=UPI0036A04111